MNDADATAIELPLGIPGPGEVLDGKCRIDGVVGVGGMGVVLAATHLHLEQRVAVKIMLPELARNAEVVERFVREGRAVVRIKSPHVVRVLDVAIRDTGEPYMVMELLDGCDLAQLLHERGPLPSTEAVDFVLEACDALAEAHAKGIIHRDLKPSNMFVAKQDDGTTMLKVLDFGISKLVRDDEQLSITKSRSILGSPHYMSPEQLRAARNVDGRSDVWSLGVILFELLSGRPPFGGDTIAELGAAVLAGTIPTLAGAKGIPEGLARVVATSMQRERDARYASIAELATALGPYASAAGQGRAAAIARKWSDGATPSSASVRDLAESSPRVVASGSPEVQTRGVWSTSTRVAKRHRSALSAIVIGTTALSFFVAWRVTRHHEPLSPSVASAAEPVSAAPVVVTTVASTTSAPAPSVVSVAASASASPAPSAAPAHSSPRPAGAHRHAPAIAASASAAPVPVASAAAALPPSPPKSDRFE